MTCYWLVMKDSLFFGKKIFQSWVLDISKLNYAPYENVDFFFVIWGIGLVFTLYPTSFTALSLRFMHSGSWRTQFHMWRSKPAREKKEWLDQSVSRVCHVGPLGVSMCNYTASNVIVLSNTDICHTSLHWLDFSPIMGAQLHPSSFSVKSSDIRSTLSAALVQLCH